MASFRKTSEGTWRADINTKGVRESKTFSTKAEASAWAARRETEIRDTHSDGLIKGKTCKEAFDRYSEEISGLKRGSKWEVLRLKAFGASELGALTLHDLTAQSIAKYRDTRLNIDGVLGSTVNREFNLMSNVFTYCVKEWRWMRENPLSDVKRPKNPPSRDRRIYQHEIDQIFMSAGYDGDVVNTKSQRVAAAFEFAIETAMRAGEICALVPERVNGAVAHLPQTKNDSKRNVPLSKRAVQILDMCKEGKNDGEPIFGITAASLDSMFRKIRDRTLIEGLTFHDSRHEAITRLAKKLQILDLARAVGHKDIRQLQVYYNETAEDIAKKLG